MLDRIFRDQAEGTFVNVGANHPRIDSNTYFFYLRGSRGVNLEPIPRLRALFDEERPEDLNLEVAATDSDGEIVLHEIVNDADETGHSSVRDDVAENHRSLTDFHVRSYPVAARTIAGLIAEHAIEPPDFMSIDVEGHEAAVLRVRLGALRRPKVLVVESLQSLTHEPTHDEWEPMLLANGYLFATFNGLNRFYLREDLADRLERLAAPVSVLDQFERADLVAAREKTAEAQSSLQYLQKQFDQLLLDREWDRDNFRRIEEGWRFGLEQAELCARPGIDKKPTSNGTAATSNAPKPTLRVLAPISTASGLNSRAGKRVGKMNGIGWKKSDERLNGRSPNWIANCARSRLCGTTPSACLPRLRWNCERIVCLIDLESCAGFIAARRIKRKIKRKPRRELFTRARERSTNCSLDHQSKRRMMVRLDRSRRSRGASHPGQGRGQMFAAHLTILTAVVWGGSEISVRPGSTNAILEQLASLDRPSQRVAETLKRQALERRWSAIRPEPWPNSKLRIAPRPIPTFSSRLPSCLGSKLDDSTGGAKARRWSIISTPPSSPSTSCSIPTRSSPPEDSLPIRAIEPRATFTTPRSIASSAPPRRSRSSDPGKVFELKGGGRDIALRLVMSHSTWDAKDLQDLMFAGDFEVTGLTSTSRRYGLGVPMIGVRKSKGPGKGEDRFFPAETAFPLTAFLTIDPKPAKAAAPEAARSAWSIRSDFLTSARRTRKRSRLKPT